MRDAIFYVLGWLATGILSFLVMLRHKTHDFGGKDYAIFAILAVVTGPVVGLLLWGFDEEYDQ